MAESTGSIVERITELVAPIADDFAVELIDVEFNHSVLKVVIDQPEGLESEVLVEVTKAVSRMIDDEDPVPGGFTLEVSSPGIERSLKKPEHFRRAIGDAVTVKTNPDVDGERRVDGRLTTADEFGITVEFASGSRTLRYGEIKSARTVFDWSPAPRPGKSKKSAGDDGPDRTAPNDRATKESAGR